MFTHVQVGLQLWTRKRRERDGDGPKDAQHVSPSPPWSASSPTASKRGAGRGARHRCACWEAGLSPGTALLSARTPFLCHWSLSPVRSVSWHVRGWREGNPGIRSPDSGPASCTAVGFPFPSRGQSPGRVHISGQLCRASFPPQAARPSSIHCWAPQAGPHLQPEPETFHNLCGFGQR